MEDGLKKRLYILAAVVIFVGVCISVVVLSSSIARRTTRDAVRIAQMREVRAALNMFFSTKGTYVLVAGQGACAAGAPISSCDDAVLNQFAQFGQYNDPTGKQVCYAGVTKPCNYSFGTSPEKDRYEICFYLESGIENSEFPASGLYSATEQGFKQGCTLTPQGQ